MASWLKRLSVVFLAAGAAGGGYVAVYGQSGTKFRPAINEFVDQGQVALKTLIETARTPSRDPAPESDQAKLPFIVIEPRDFAAPMIRLPGDARPVAMAAAPLVPANQRADVRLSAGPEQFPADLNPVEARLRARVAPELFGYFDLFLYVSKATPDKGDWAQRMFVLTRQPGQGQHFRLVHNWPVSTGREQLMPSPSGEMLGTHTPEGVFKLDRNRFHQDYRSRQWDSPMPFAMFFDWRVDGRPSGLALHGSDEQGEKELGTRASHGCIRLATENAKTLFHLIRDNYRGRVPVFQVNPKTGTMSTAGALLRDENGKVVMTNGYKVLVFIEDFGGPSLDTVAALF